MARIRENIKNLDDLYGRVLRLEENVRNNNTIQEQLKDQQQQMNIDDLYRRIFCMEENIRNNNAILEQLINQMEEAALLSAQVKAFKRRLDKLSDEVHAVSSGAVSEQSKAAQAAVQPGDSYGKIDYFDFENHFRGDREAIKMRQEEYMPYFAGRKRVVDLGCGRGEFLELLRERGVGAQGVDLYDEFVIYCQGRHLDVVEGDALDYLDSIEGTDGIFAGQLVEHLSIGQIMALCDKAYEKLEEGACLIMETPNPMSLAIYTHAFYIDPSHQKPVHPYTLRYLAVKSGFRQVDILFTQGSRLTEPIPQLNETGSVTEEEFNRNLRVMAEYMYGSQDYAVIARK